MKKLITTLLLFGLLFGFIFAVFNTLSLFSLQKNIDFNPNSLTLSTSEIENISKALRYETVADSNNTNNEEFKNFHQFIKTNFAHLHQNTAISYQIFNNNAILYKWKSKNSKQNPAIWIAAQDVATPELKNVPLWKYNPFVGKYENDTFYGAGAATQKMALIAMLSAWELHSKTEFYPQKDIYLLLSADNYSLNALDCKTAATVFYKQDIRFSYVLAAGGLISADNQLVNDKNIAFVGTSSKNKLHFSAKSINNVNISELLLKISTLSSKISLSENSTAALNKYLSPELEFFDRFLFANEAAFGYFVKQKLLKDSFLNAAFRVETQILAIDSTNGQAEFIIYLPQSYNVEQFCNNIITDSANYIISIIEKQVFANNTAADSWEFGLLERIIKQEFKKTIVFPAPTYQFSPASYFQKISDKVFYFSPLLISTNDWANYNNNINPNINTAAYIKMKLFYYQLLSVQ